MANKHWKWLPVCVFAALAGCGGGGDSDVAGPVEPPPTVQQGLGQLELFTGKVMADLGDCRPTVNSGPASEAGYSRLLRATAYPDGVYLTETGEGCTNVNYPPIGGGFVSDNVQATIRKVSGGMDEVVVFLNSYISLMSHPVMVRYPSGFQRDPSTGDFFVLSYVAASSDLDFALDEQEVNRYTAQGGWTYYAPGLFKFPQTETIAGYSNLAAGAPGLPPAYLDGQGPTASFVAPHDLEMDASGLLYLIDKGQIRTIDADYQVKTLDRAALGIVGDVRALDSDLQGRIHVLTQRSNSDFSWYRLADGSKVDFSINDRSGETMLAPFAVVGNDLIVGMRAMGSDVSGLYRISGANGAVTPLTGNGTPATPQDLLDNPSQYVFPAVQHVEYGPDGNLYIVLQQGVLVARNFK